MISDYNTVSMISDFCKAIKPNTERNFSMKEFLNEQNEHFVHTPYMSSNLREYNRIYKEVNDIYREIAAKFGLSNSTFDILYTICEVGDGCLQKDVCDATFIPKQTVNSSIRKLEQEGYLTFSSGKGREKHIHLTESGHTLLKKTIFPIVKAENQAFTELSQEECETLLKLHGKYISALRAKFSEL